MTWAEKHSYTFDEAINVHFNKGPYTMRSSLMDLLIENEKGNLIAAVEVKNLPNITQEEAVIASNILILAQEGKIELAFPSFALSEPFTTLMNRHGKRTSLYNSLRTTWRDIKRSEPMKQTVLGIESLLDALVAANEIQRFA